ncbi:MAG: S8 family peptidase [Chloroflexota bacterium]
MNPTKIAADIQTQMESVPNQDGIPVIIRHRSGLFFSQAIGEVETYRQLVTAKAMQLRARDIVSLSQIDEVEYIWADLPVRAYLDRSIPTLGVPEVWSENVTGSGIKLAIIDTGLDRNHPDFAGRVVATRSFIAGEGPDDDLNGHGTHVAGTAAGSGVKSGGTYRGVAPDALLYIAKVLGSGGGGSTSSVMSGIEWAVEQGVQVINLSLGIDGACDGTDALSVICDAAVTERGITIFAAAGNTGPGASTVGSPGCAREVITVGSVDENDRISGFSSRGPTKDGRTKPDIVFPGQKITAPQAEGTLETEVVAPGYVSLQGTSMATPHAAGAACLLLQKNPELTPAQIKSIFNETAIDLNVSDNDQGSGRGNVSAAYQKVVADMSPEPEPPTPEPEPPTPEPEPPTPEPPTPEPEPPTPEPEPPTPEPPKPEPVPDDRKGCLAGMFGGLLGLLS